MSDVYDDYGDVSVFKDYEIKEDANAATEREYFVLLKPDLDIIRFKTEPVTNGMSGYILVVDNDAMWCGCGCGSSHVAEKWFECILKDAHLFVRIGIYKVTIGEMPAKEVRAWRK